MNNEVTLTQLTTEMTQLRQQLDLVHQRLDMIYGAVTRLAEAKPVVPSPAANNFTTPQASSGDPDVEHRPRRLAQEGSKFGEETALPPSSTTGMPLSARMMMDPSGMLDSLRQYALNAGLSVSSETVDRLKSDLPAGETENGSKRGI